MNKQSHFEPKPTLRATSVFAARPHFAQVRSSRRGASLGRKYPFYPLISDDFTFPMHVHRFLRDEARPVPV